jgi:dTDP-4-amino-4,6-dideoxygalactose transaminase
MRVPLLDLSEQYRILAEPLRHEIDEVLCTQRFILGPKLERFERAICDYTGARFAIGVSSGTDALLALLMASGVGPDDAVITSAYSFFATAGSLARVGATPVFVDIDRETFNLSAVALDQFLERQCGRTPLPTYRGKKVRAILPVHLFGLCCEMDAIRSVADRYQLPIIEDAAQAIGAEFPGQSGPEQAGTMGSAGCFSFYPSKNLGAAGDAGLIITNDEDLARRLRVCRNHGMEPQYFHQTIGGNFRLDEIQAAILSVKLPHLNQWSAARRAVADFYREEFIRVGLTEKIGLPAEPFRGRGLNNHHIYHQYVIRVPQRDALREHLRQKEIGSAIYYPLGLHQQKCFAALGYQRGDLPETERAAEETVALPVYPEITREAQQFVVAEIAEFYSR